MLGVCWGVFVWALRQANFLINGMHELGHGFVFKTQSVQNLFLRVISFLGWLHPDMFFSSHFRHHRYTQKSDSLRGICLPRRSRS